MLAGIEDKPKKVQMGVKFKPSQTIIDVYDEPSKAFLRYTFKDYMKSKNAFTYRCASRNECQFQIRLSIEDNFALDKEEKTVIYYKFKDETQPLSWSVQDKTKMHTCQANREENKHEAETKVYHKDKKVLEDYVRKNSLLSASKIKFELEQQHQKFTKDEINAELHRIRAEKYPKDSFLIFNPMYCKSLDDPRQNLFRYYIKTPAHNDHREYSEIVILSSQFQLARLAQSSEWYIDGTFWCCPRNFYQMLNIIVFSQEIGRSICVVHILIGSKKPEEYITAFINLLIAANNSKTLISPKFIMSDFEKGLRSALQWVFPKATLLGCEFHFVKALWKKAGKLGLRKKERKRKTAIIINFLVIIVHLNVEDRSKYFQELKTNFQHEEKPFQEFLTYFHKNWMELDFINLGENREKLTRTNNYCEGFHSYLSKIYLSYLTNLEHLINHPHPAPAILLEALKEYEFTIRQEAVDSFRNGNSQRIIEEPVSLPFHKLMHYNDKIQEEINKKRVSLEDVIADEEFFQIMKTFFSNLIL